MKKTLTITAILLLVAALGFAQDPSASAAGSQTSTQSSDQSLRGCLSGSEGNFTLASDNGQTIKLSGDDAKLKEHVGHMVEVKGMAEQGSADASAASSGASQPQSFAVSDVQMISESCSSQTSSAAPADQSTASAAGTTSTEQSTATTGGVTSDEQNTGNVGNGNIAKDTTSSAPTDSAPADQSATATTTPDANASASASTTTPDASATAGTTAPDASASATTGTTTPDASASASTTAPDASASGTTGTPAPDASASATTETTAPDASASATTGTTSSDVAAGQPATSSESAGMQQDQQPAAPAASATDPSADQNAQANAGENQQGTEVAQNQLPQTASPLPLLGLLGLGSLAAGFISRRKKEPGRSFFRPLQPNRSGQPARAARFWALLSSR
jgi:lysozyme